MATSLQVLIILACHNTTVTASIICCSTFKGLRGQEFKALQRALAKAKESAKYERPLLSQILDCFCEEQDNLIKLAHEHNKETKKSKRDDEHLAALARLGKQAASASHSSSQASHDGGAVKMCRSSTIVGHHCGAPARPYRQTAVDGLAT